MPGEHKMLLCDECNRAVGEVMPDGTIRLFHRHDKATHVTRLQVTRASSNHQGQVKESGNDAVDTPKYG